MRLFAHIQRFGCAPPHFLQVSNARLACRTSAASGPNFGVRKLPGTADGTAARRKAALNAIECAWTLYSRMDARARFGTGRDRLHWEHRSGRHAGRAGNTVGAAVATNPATATVQTDGAGAFTLASIPIGAYDVTASKAGYTDGKLQAVGVAAGEP